MIMSERDARGPQEEECKRPLDAPPGDDRFATCLVRADLGRARRHRLPDLQRHSHRSGARSSGRERDARAGRGDAHPAGLRPAALGPARAALPRHRVGQSRHQHLQPAPHIALPALTLALPAAATIVRFTRAGVLDVINSNHVLYQRAMGLPPGLIVWKYVLRNAMISTVTQIGLIFGVLVTNAVIVETVFDWPGIGTFAVQSILQSDHKAIIGFTIWIGALIVIVNLLVDITHSFIDPRGTR